MTMITGSIDRSSDASGALDDARQQSGFVDRARSAPAALALDLVLLGALALTLARVPGWIDPDLRLDGNARVSGSFNPSQVSWPKKLSGSSILLGNSMLESRIDEDLLREFAGVDSIVLSHGGMASAYWYLQLKNLIIPAGVKPKAIFIFFRDQELTDPTFRTTGPYRKAILSLATADEPLLTELTTRREGSFGALVTAVENRFGGGATADRVRDWFAALPITLWSGGRTRFVERLNGRFKALASRTHVAPDDTPDRYAAERLDFGSRVDRSFLPEMLRLARQHGLHLAFYRVQRRPRADGSLPRSAELKPYFDALRRYLGQQGATLLEEAGDSRLTLETYGDGDHIRGAYRRLATAVFVDRVRGIIR